MLAALHVRFDEKKNGRNSDILRSELSKKRSPIKAV